MTTCLILGGSDSGKSQFAESLLRDAPHVLYIATTDPLSLKKDAEMRQRIEKHKQRRPKHWQTLIEHRDLPALLNRIKDDRRPKLIDSLTPWLAYTLNQQHNSEDVAERLMQALNAQHSQLVIVSHDVATGITPNTKIARQFMQRSGIVQQRIAAYADDVIYVIAGLPLWLKTHSTAKRDQSLPPTEPAT